MLRGAHWNAVAALALATVAVLSLLPLAGPAPELAYGDKLAHLLIYALLGGWAAINPHGISALRCLLALAAYGLLIELLQGLLPWRSFEWLDLAADAAGAALGLAAPRLLPRSRGA